MTDIQAQDCELEYWNQQAEDYALVQIPCEDLRAIITRAWKAPAFNSALSAAETRAEAAEEKVTELVAALKMCLPHMPWQARIDVEAFILSSRAISVASSTLKGTPDGR